MKNAWFGSKISDNIFQTPEGFLICRDVPIARTGYQEYLASDLDLGAADGYSPDDIVRVYRDEADVFSPATIASFEGKSLTKLHPPTFLDPTNDRGYSLGHVQHVHRQDDKLIADLVIKDQQLIDQVLNNTMREVSCGYRCHYEPRGNKEYRQYKILGNHVAIVPSGRAGSEVRIYDADNTREGSMSVSKTVEEILKFFNVGDTRVEIRDDGTHDPNDVVQRNAKYHAEALERAERRNMDAEELKMRQQQDSNIVALNTTLTSFLAYQKSRDEEMKKEAKEKEEKDRKARDEWEAKEKKEKEEKEEKDRKAKDAAEEEEKKRKENEGKDSDLIEAETMTGNEVPKNPIPGADEALKALRLMKDSVIASKDPKAIDAYNKAILAIKGRKADDSGYAALLETKKPELLAVTDADTKQQTICDDFKKAADKFHRKNVAEVKGA